MNTHNIELHGFKLQELVEETSRTVVWKAVQTILDRTVIIRILKEEAAADPTEVLHFLTIARQFARIKSDSIAAVFDIVSEGDLHYVVMEHVDGPTLEELVTSRGPLPVEQVLRIGASLVISLEQMWDAAHIVHRNLKSSTILLDPRGVAKITDFSLAISAGPGVNATAMDRGLIVGTPCFLSPEQAQGSHILNTQSDMYALGAVLYHLATGVVPFEGNDVVTILGAHVKSQIPPPHVLNKDIPPSFSWFVHRLMMKNPNNRYANWGDVLLDIRSQLAGEVPSCVRPDEEFLSTIDALFTPDDSEAKKTWNPDSPRIRLNVKEKTRIASYSTNKAADEHASTLRREASRQEALLWGLLGAWLAALFWFRAVHQAPRAQAENGQARPQAAHAPAAQKPESPDTGKGDSDIPPFVEPGAAEIPAPTKLSAPVVRIPAPKPKPVAAPPSAAPSNTAAASQPPAPAPLAQGIPPALAHELAKALAAGDLAAARSAAKASKDLFQEKQALQALLDKIPEPDSLVSDHLQTQIGKPLIFEHNGKQRTVIPRGVENGAIHIEMNGRGVEFEISKLTADEKLRWMDKPKDEAQSVAYCLTLLHSSQKSEVPSKAAACPLLAPILSEAASLVQEKPATPSVE